MAKRVVSVEGLSDIEAALKQFKPATAKSVLRRVLKKRAQPIADEAARLAPAETGDLKDSISVSTRIKNTTGNAEYSAVLRGGGTKKEAGAALRAARTAAKGESPFVEVFIGPERGRNSKVGVLQEFGTSRHPAQPFMRPAWDSGKDGVLDGIKDDLWAEIEKTAKRAAKRAAKKG